VKYHSCGVAALTHGRQPAWGQGLVGSLTGAVASQTVTEAPNGPLRPDGNRPLACIGARGLDCEADEPSRDESRAK
jgi:hypothetical protein